MAPKIQRAAPPKPTAATDIPQFGAYFGVGADAMRVAQIDISAIADNPHQARTIFAENAIQSLAKSIERVGLQQPISVRESGGDGYILVSGERRLRAHKLLGRTTINAVVMPHDRIATAAEASLIENVLRVDLDAVDLAQGLQALIESKGITQEEAGQVVGMSKTAISRLLNVLTLPSDILNEYRTLTERVPQAVLIELAGIEDKQTLRELWAKAKGGLLRRDEVRETVKRPVRQGSEMLVIGRTLQSLKKGVEALRTVNLEQAHRNELRELRDTIDQLLG